MFRFINKHAPFITLHLLLFVIFAMNFHSGKMFIGWDSVNPELNFELNFDRALYSGWQEYYGLGLLGGHGFAALAPHALISKGIAFLAPQWAIRTLFTYLALYLGVIGMYCLIDNLLQKLQNTDNTLEKIQSVRQWLSLLGAITYIFNLATIQQIYTQTEAFTFHFMSLPWLCLVVILLLERTNIQRILLFLIVNIVASGQGFVPPIFVVYVGLLVTFLFSYTVFRRFSKDTLLKVSLILILTFCANAYWLGPFSYYTLSGKQEDFINSYNNRIQTVEFVEKSKKYGNVGDVALAKGFFWEAQDGQTYILKPWIDHLKSTPIRTYGYIVFFIGVLGLFAIFRSRSDPILKSMGLVYLFFFANIAVETPPFSYITHLLRDNSSLFEQVFRNAFTKFSLGLGFNYSIFYVVGCWFIIRLVENCIRANRRISLYIAMVLILFSVTYGLPAFKGHLFYEKLHVKVPQQYFDFISYFRDQPDGHIADLPQDCSEGWYSYNWGYFGSGFLWYGVKQPFLSRTFDVWSKYNEKYYWELSQALRRKDAHQLESVLRKYDVKWIVYDPNLQHCNNQKVFLKQEDFLTVMKSSDKYSLVKTFAGESWLPLYLFKVKESPSQSYITIQGKTQNVDVAQWTDYDLAFNTDGSYISNRSQPYDKVYPYSGLFTKRGDINPRVDIIDKNEVVRYIAYSKSKLNTDAILWSDSPFISEDVVYAEISLKPTSNDPSQNSILLRISPPKVYIDDTPIYDDDKTLVIGTLGSEIRMQDLEVLTGSFKGVYAQGVIKLVLMTKTDNSILVTSKVAKTPVSLMYQTGILADIYDKPHLSETITNVENRTIVVEAIKIPQLSYGVNPQLNQTYPVVCAQGKGFYETPVEQSGVIRIIDKNSQSCLKIYLDTLETVRGYIVHAKIKHITGLPITIEMSNQDQGVILRTPLGMVSEDWFTYSHILPPGGPYGLGYELNLINRSLNTHDTINEISDLEVVYAPLNLLQSIKLVSRNILPRINDARGSSLSVTHPHEHLYKVNSANTPANPILVLNQGYDKGWVLFEGNSNIFSSLLTPAPNHFIVDGWKNGWNISQNPKVKSATYTIIYWPQYLEFVGVIITTLLLVFVSILYATQRLRRTKESIRNNRQIG